MDVKLAKTQTIKSSGRLKTLDSLKVPEFRLLLGAQAWGWLGMGMIMIANPLLLYRLSGSALLVGVMSLASCIPVLLLSLFGGTIADRIQKKYILVGSRSGMAITWLIIALALSLGYLSKNNSGSWWILIFCAALNGILMALANPAAVAIIPELIGQDRVMNGLALNNLGMNIFGFIGPALTGFLVDARGFSVVYFLMAGLFCVSAIAMIFLPRGTRANITNTRSTIGDILESFKYISRETVFLAIVILLIFHMLGSTGYTQLTAVFTESILKVSATKLGILGSVASFAAILGSFVLASLPLKKRGLLFLFSNILVSVGIMVFASSRWWYLSLGMAFLASAGMSMQMIMSPTLVQTHADPNYRSRMQGFLFMAQGLGSFGAFFAGALSKVIGIQWAVGGLAGLLFIVTIISWIFTKQLRRLD